MRKIEWLNDDLTRAVVTVESKTSRWWRRRYVTAEVILEPDVPGALLFTYDRWRFVVGGDKVSDHDHELACALVSRREIAELDRACRAHRAKLKNPWSEQAELPRAEVRKR